MAAKRVPFAGSSTTLAPIKVSVTATANGAGQRVSSATATQCFTLANTDTSGAIEYKYSSAGAWTYLGKGVGATITGDLSFGVLVRLINDGSASVSIEVTGETPAAGNAPALITDGLNNVVGLGGYGGAVAIEARPAYRKQNYLKTGAIPLDNMDACVGATTRWAKFGAGTGVISASSDYALTSLGCASSMKMAGPMTALERWQSQLPTPYTPSTDGVMSIWLYITAMPMDYTTTPATERTTSFQVILSADSTFTTTTATSMSFTSLQFLHPGYNCLQLSSSDDGTLNSTGNPCWTYGGSAPGTAATTYTHMRIVFGSFQPAASTTPDIYLCGVFAGGTSTPRVIVNIDDGHSDTLDLANLFNSYGIPISSGIVTGSVGVGDNLTVAELKALEARGNDIVAHSVTHPGGGIVNLPLASQVDEIVKSRQFMLDNGFLRGSSVMFYPQNAFNGRLLDIVKDAGFTLGRASVNALTPISQGLANPLCLGSSDLGGKTLAQVKKRLDAATLYGALQILYGHDIYSVPVQSATYSNGVVTVNATGHGYSNGNLAYIRGAAEAEYRTSGIVENATANTFTFKTANVLPASATSKNGNLRTFSPNFPAANGGTAPSPATLWYYSDYVALAKEINARRNAGTLFVDTFASLIENVRVAS
jgi:hypothetical protein